MKKRKKVNMSTVDSFFAQRHIKVAISHIKLDLPYFNIIEAVAVVNVDSPSRRKAIAHVASLSRLSGDDLGRGRGDIGERVATGRAKRGLYALLRGKEIHDPLCQGSLEHKELLNREEVIQGEER